MSASVGNFATVHVSARVVSVTDPAGSLGGAVTAGDDVLGWYTFDMNAPDQHGNAKIGWYRFDASPSGMRFEVGALVFRSDPASLDMSINLKNNNPHDNCDVVSASNMDVLPNVGVASIALNFADDDASALASDALTGAETTPSDWTRTRELRIDGADGWSVVASVDWFGDEPSNPITDKFQPKEH
jgi:hypothetical protein